MLVAAAVYDGPFTRIEKCAAHGTLIPAQRVLADRPAGPACGNQCGSFITPFNPPHAHTHMHGRIHTRAHAHTHRRRESPALRPREGLFDGLMKPRTSLRGSFGVGCLRSAHRLHGRMGLAPKHSSKTIRRRRKNGGKRPARVVASVRDTLLCACRQASLRAVCCALVSFSARQTRNAPRGNDSSRARAGVCARASLLFTLMNGINASSARLHRRAGSLRQARAALQRGARHVVGTLCGGSPRAAAPPSAQAGKNILGDWRKRRYCTARSNNGGAGMQPLLLGMGSRGHDSR